MNFIKAVNSFGFAEATVMFIYRKEALPKDLLKRADVEQLIDLYLFEFELGGFQPPQEETFMEKVLFEIEKRVDQNPQIREYVLSEIEHI